MKKSILLFLIIISSELLFAQQLPQFSLRAYDLMNYNPAVVGSNLNSEIRMHHRSQWVGFENAPNSDILSYNASINKIGLGASIYYDSEVITKKIGVNLMYAYHIFCNKFNISLGSNAGIQQNQLSTSSLNPFDKNDPLLTSELAQTIWIPNVGGGIFIYNWNYYIGTSFTYYLPFQLSKGDYNKATQSFFYYAMGGYNFHLSDNFNLLAQTFLSGQQNSNMQFEFGLKGLFIKVYSLGVSYRPNDAIVLSTSIKIYKSILIAYSYDIVISKLRNYNSGSHEIVISYEFDSNNSLYYKNENRIKKKIYSDINF